MDDIAVVPSIATLPDAPEFRITPGARGLAGSDAAELGRTLLALANTTNGNGLTPEAVAAAAARDPTSLLYQRVYDCPPHEAAARYYVDRARYILRSIDIRVGGQEPGAAATWVRLMQPVCIVLGTRPVAPPPALPANGMGAYVPIARPQVFLSSDKRYLPDAAIRAEPLYAAQVLANARRDMLAFMAKYQRYCGLPGYAEVARILGPALDAVQLSLDLEGDTHGG